MLDAVTTNPHHTPPGNSRAAPLVIAHRTTMGHAPENTLVGVRRGLELGVDGIEIDVQLSADGVPVLMHDQLLDRTTSGDGVVGETTLARLRMLDAGEGELTWSADTIFEYLLDPKAFMREVTGDKRAKSRMVFKLKKEDDRRDVIAFLETLR